MILVIKYIGFKIKPNGSTHYFTYDKERTYGETLSMIIRESVTDCIEELAPNTVSKVVSAYMAREQLRDLKEKESIMEDK